MQKRANFVSNVFHHKVGRGQHVATFRTTEPGFCDMSVGRIPVARGSSRERFSRENGQEQFSDPDIDFACFLCTVPTTFQTWMRWLSAGASALIFDGCVVDLCPGSKKCHTVCVFWCRLSATVEIFDAKNRSNTMVGVKMGDRLGASSYAKKSTAHPRAVMRNRRGFRGEDTRDEGRHRPQVRKATPTLSALRGRVFRDRITSVERAVYSAIRTCDRAMRANRNRKRCPNWKILFDNAKVNMRKPRIAAALQNRKPLEVEGDAVVIPLPTLTGRLPTKLLVGKLIGTDKGATSRRAFIKTHRATLCVPQTNVFMM